MRTGSTALVRQCFEWPRDAVWACIYTCEDGAVESSRLLAMGELQGLSWEFLRANSRCIAACIPSGPSVACYVHAWAS
jgi:hypothetical protein